MRIGVIGAGYLGASFAYHAAELGADVVVFDRGGIGKGASGATFACLNAFGYTDAEYTAFRYEAIGYLRDLAARCGGASFLHNEHTTRFADQYGAVALQEKAAHYSELGFPLQYRTKDELRAAHPYLHVEAASGAAIEVPGEGWADIQALAGVLLHHANIELRLNERIVDIRLDGHMRLASAQCSRAVDAIVIAAGIDTPGLAAMIGTAPMIRKIPGVMLRLRRARPKIDSVLYGPGIHLHGLEQADLIAGIEDGKDESALSGDIVASRTSLCLERLSRWVPSLEFESCDTVIGVRPVPADDLPVAGPLREGSGAYVLAAHGGATMGARLGYLLAQQIVLGRSDTILLRFRVERGVEVTPGLPAPGGGRDAVGAH